MVSTLRTKQMLFCILQCNNLFIAHKMMSKMIYSIKNGPPPQKTEKYTGYTGFSTMQISKSDGKKNKNVYGV